MDPENLLSDITDFIAIDEDESRIFNLLKEKKDTRRRVINPAITSRDGIERCLPTICPANAPKIRESRGIIKARK